MKIKHEVQIPTYFEFLMETKLKFLIDHDFIEHFNEQNHGQDSFVAIFRIESYSGR